MNMLFTRCGYLHKFYDAEESTFDIKALKRYDLAKSNLTAKLDIILRKFSPFSVHTTNQKHVSILKVE